MHRVWLGVDSGDPVQKLMRYHFGWCEETLGLGALAAISMILRSGSRDVQISSRQKLAVHALVSGLESIGAFRSESSHGIMSDFC